MVHRASHPGLVRAPQGEGVHILCGARDTEVLQALRRVAEVREVPQLRTDGPPVIHVWYTNARDLHMGLSQAIPEKKLAISGNVAYRLAKALPPLEAWKDSLPSLQGIAPSMYHLKIFETSTFHDVAQADKSGLYKLTPLQSYHSSTSRDQYLFYEAGNHRWLSGDFSDLLFLALSTAHGGCPVRYKPATYRLAIPRRWRWPHIYERALILASGQLSRVNERWLVYEAVSPELFKELATKLPLQCEEIVSHA